MYILYIFIIEFYRVFKKNIVLRKCRWAHSPLHACQGHRTILGSQFSLSTLLKVSLVSAADCSGQLASLFPDDSVSASCLAVIADMHHHIWLFTWAPASEAFSGLRGYCLYPLSSPLAFHGDYLFIFKITFIYYLCVCVQCMCVD